MGNSTGLPSQAEWPVQSTIAPGTTARLVITSRHLTLDARESNGGYVTCSLDAISSVRSYVENAFTEDAVAVIAVTSRCPIGPPEWKPLGGKEAGRSAVTSELAREDHEFEPFLNRTRDCLTVELRGQLGASLARQLGAMIIGLRDMGVFDVREGTDPSFPLALGVSEQCVTRIGDAAWLTTQRLICQNGRGIQEIPLNSLAWACWRFSSDEDWALGMFQGKTSPPSDVTTRQVSWRDSLRRGATTTREVTFGHSLPHLTFVPRGSRPSDVATEYFEMWRQLQGSSGFRNWLRHRPLKVARRASREPFFASPVASCALQVPRDMAMTQALAVWQTLGGHAAHGEESVTKLELQGLSVPALSQEVECGRHEQRSLTIAWTNYRVLVARRARALRATYLWEVPIQDDLAITVGPRKSSSRLYLWLRSLMRPGMSKALGLAIAPKDSLADARYHSLSQSPVGGAMLDNPAVALSGGLWGDDPPPVFRLGHADVTLAVAEQLRTHVRQVLTGVTADPRSAAESHEVLLCGLRRKEATLKLDDGAVWLELDPGKVAWELRLSDIAQVISYRTRWRERLVLVTAAPYDELQYYSRDFVDATGRYPELSTRGKSVKALREDLSRWIIEARSGVGHGAGREPGDPEPREVVSSERLASHEQELYRQGPSGNSVLVTSHRVRLRRRVGGYETETDIFTEDVVGTQRCQMSGWRQDYLKVAALAIGGIGLVVAMPSFWRVVPLVVFVAAGYVWWRLCGSNPFEHLVLLTASRASDWAYLLSPPRQPVRGPRPPLLAEERKLRWVGPPRPKGVPRTVASRLLSYVPGEHDELEQLVASVLKAGVEGGLSAELEVPAGCQPGKGPDGGAESPGDAGGNPGWVMAGREAIQKTWTLAPGERRATARVIVSNWRVRVERTCKVSGWSGTTKWDLRLGQEFGIGRSAVPARFVGVRVVARVTGEFVLPRRAVLALLYGFVLSSVVFGSAYVAFPKDQSLGTWWVLFGCAAAIAAYSRLISTRMAVSMHWRYVPVVYGSALPPAEGTPINLGNSVPDPFAPFHRGVVFRRPTEPRALPLYLPVPGPDGEDLEPVLTSLFEEARFS